MRRRFFVEKFEAQRAELRGEAAEHLGRVLRAEPGQLYELSDGEQVWLGRIEKISRAAIGFALIERIAAEESALRIKLLLSIVKFDRMEWCLEKATELGVMEIVPLAAARSEKALILAAAKRSSRWRRIMIESAQQSRRLRPPSLAEIAKVEDAFDAAKESVKILLSERVDASPLREILHGVSAKEVYLAIGPEGGWTDAEFAAATKNGFREASLGREILRTETAVIASLAILRYALEKC
jgi:16S rRNA (uracil1498-N3)-methyltransferase